MRDRLLAGCEHRREPLLVPRERLTELVPPGRLGAQLREAFRAAGERRVELPQHVAGVAGDAHLDIALDADLLRLDVHLDQLRVGSEALSHLEHPVEPRRQHHHHVGSAYRLAAGGGDVERVVVRDVAASHGGSEERHAEVLDELPEVPEGFVAGPADALANNQQRALRVEQQLGRLLDQQRIALRPRRRRGANGRADFDLLDLLAQHVEGEVDVDGAGAAAERLVKGHRDQFGDARGRVCLDRPLRDRLHHRDGVGFLKRISPALVQRRGAAEEQQRVAAVPRDVDAGDRVRDAGAGARHRHADLAGDVAVRDRHH